MYLYYDNTGTLKEIYTDLTLHIGSSGWNEIFCYFEGDSVNISNCFIKYLKPDNTFTSETAGSVTNKTLPYDNKRDLQFFEFGHTYKFRKFVIPDVILGSAGNYAAFIRYTDGTNYYAMTEATFDVSGGNLTLDPEITISQYNYLLIHGGTIKGAKLCGVTQTITDGIIDISLYRHKLTTTSNYTICVITNNSTFYTNTSFCANIRAMGGKSTMAGQPVIYSLYGGAEYVSNLDIEMLNNSDYFTIGYLDLGARIYVENEQIVSDTVEEL